MISPNETTEGAPAPAPEPAPTKVVKAIPSSPIYAIFDIVEVEEKQIVTGQIGFVDQFGMERTAKTGTDLGVLNLGKHILEIFAGRVDITEPSEEDKAKLSEMIQKDVMEAKTKILNAYREASNAKDN